MGKVKEVKRKRRKWKLKRKGKWKWESKEIKGKENKGNERK